jgi:anti-sigma regulatory factor (Ser/Thr protein kinase)
VFAGETLAAWSVPAEDVEAVRLVVSELVTNAVVHAHETESITLEVARAGSNTLRVLVSDDSPHRPEKGTDLTWLSESGRGVEVVDALADRWGTQARRPRGKTVWCEVTTNSVGRA